MSNLPTTTPPALQPAQIQHADVNNAVQWGAGLKEQVDKMGDFLIEAFAQWLEAGTRACGRAVANGCKNVAAAASSVRDMADKSFNAFPGAKSEGQEPSLARSKQLQIDSPPQHVPEHVKEHPGVQAVAMNNAQVLASQMVTMPDGMAVSPSAVGFGQSQSQGIAIT